MKVLIGLELCLCLLSSCSRTYNRENVSGTYVPVYYELTVDTLVLHNDGTYDRKILDISRMSTWEMKGRWQVSENGELKIESFFLNLDRDILRYPEILADTTSACSRYLEVKEGKTQVCFGYFEGENCYRKID